MRLTETAQAFEFDSFSTRVVGWSDQRDTFLRVVSSGCWRKDGSEQFGAREGLLLTPKIRGLNRVNEASGLPAELRFVGLKDSSS